MPPRDRNPNPFETPDYGRSSVDQHYRDEPYSSTPGIPLGATSSRSPFPAASSADRFYPEPSYGNNGMYDDYTPRPQTTKSNSNKKWIYGTIIAILIIAAIAVPVAVVVSNKNKNRTGGGSSSGSSSDSPNSPNSPNTPQNPNDPSSFTKNPAFHQSFYGMAYTPANSQLPNCGNSLSAVIADIQVMSQLTSRVRLYGADCNQSALVLEAIKQTKVNMQVFLGNYPIATDNGTAYQRQRDVILQALKTYGKDHVAGITVGNEFMLNYLGANSISDLDINSAAANAGAAILIGFIEDMKNKLEEAGFGSIPVGNSDAGSYFNNEVLAAVSYGLANVHPWFANVTADDSATWTYDFFQQNDVALAANLTNKPTMYIAETGWPTNSSTLAAATDGPSNASDANLQIFLNNFICQANANGTLYFFFEFADEQWKTDQFGGVEGYWGLFYQNLTLKEGITIPDCQSP